MCLTHKKWCRLSVDNIQMGMTIALIYKISPFLKGYSALIVSQKHHIGHTKNTSCRIELTFSLIL